MLAFSFMFLFTQIPFNSFSSTIKGYRKCSPCLTLFIMIDYVGGFVDLFLLIWQSWNLSAKLIKLDSCSGLNIKARNMLKFSLLVEALNKLRQENDGVAKGSGGADDDEYYVEACSIICISMGAHGQYILACCWWCCCCPAVVIVVVGFDVFRTGQSKCLNFFLLPVACRLQLLDKKSGIMEKQTGENEGR